MCKLNVQMDTHMPIDLQKYIIDALCKIPDAVGTVDFSRKQLLHDKQWSKKLEKMSR